MGRRLRSFRFPGARDGRRRGDRGAGALCKNRGMELTWYGRTCIRLRGKDAVVVNDPYPAIVGPTGRGITGDVVTFSHPDDAAAAQEGDEAVARRRDRDPDEPRAGVRARRPGRVRGPRRPADRRPDLPRRRQGRGARPPDRVRDRARRDPHDPPRRHRPRADRGEARRHRAGRHRVRADRRRPHRAPAPPRSSPSSIPRSSSRCRSARTRRTARTR